MMQAAELAVLDWLQAHLRCDFLDAVMPWISRICDHGEIWILLAAVLLPGSSGWWSLSPPKARSWKSFPGKSPMPTPPSTSAAPCSGCRFCPGWCGWCVRWCRKKRKNKKKLLMPARYGELSAFQGRSAFIQPLSLLRRQLP